MKNKEIIKRLGEYLKIYKKSLIISVILAIISSVFSIIAPMLSACALDSLTLRVLDEVSGKIGIDFDKVANALIIYLALILFGSALSFIQSTILNEISIKANYTLRNDIMRKINHIPLKNFDEMNKGDILSRVVNDVDALNSALTSTIPTIVASLITFVGSLSMMIYYSIQLTLISICIIPLSIFIIVLIVSKTQKYFRGFQKYLGQLNGHIEEMYSSHSTMKAFNGEEKSVEKFDEYNDTLYNASWKSEFFSGLLSPIMSFITNISYIIMCVVGGFLALNGQITIGGIQAFIQYSNKISGPVTQLLGLSNLFQSTAAAAERIFEFLDIEEESDDLENPIKICNEDSNSNEESCLNLKGSVQFAHVGFSYNEKSGKVIDDFSINIKPGQKVAIVGSTGAGKTTIVKLLMRFYDVSEGAILIDGYDIKSFNRSDLRTVLGMVLQETWLYSGSIRDNIRYGRLSASDKDVESAAKMIGADHFIKTLPNGYDMLLGEDVQNISLGERQLISIARTILSDPKILILDEATSSVDTRTEKIIVNAMERLMENRTCFIIAHRLSTIRNADMIIVMDKGKIAEIGTHEELLSANGIYCDIYNSQFAVIEKD